ncbi:basic helix-loop-helix domain-containing protein [Endozoicomonas sp. Mp262]|uniref:basic helix-loop-helix domain-containing protein n=1 Tax=Endozoicomonas sp. Mp262 TaxID=2919499 RepID=UPI0021D9E306
MNHHLKLHPFFCLSVYCLLHILLTTANAAISEITVSTKPSGEIIVLAPRVYRAMDEPDTPPCCTDNEDEFEIRVSLDQKRNILDNQRDALNYLIKHTELCQWNKSTSKDVFLVMSCETPSFPDLYLQLVAASMCGFLKSSQKNETGHQWLQTLEPENEIIKLEDTLAMNQLISQGEINSTNNPSQRLIERNHDVYLESLDTHDNSPVQLLLKQKTPTLYTHENNYIFCSECELTYPFSNQSQSKPNKKEKLTIYLTSSSPLKVTVQVSRPPITPPPAMMRINPLPWVEIKQQKNQDKNNNVFIPLNGLNPVSTPTVFLIMLPQKMFFPKKPAVKEILPYQGSTNPLIQPKEKEESCLKRVKRLKSLPQTESVTRRNSRERVRVEKINEQFQILKQHVPRNGKSEIRSKKDILNSAIGYIKELKDMLKQDEG